MKGYDPDYLNRMEVLAELMIRFPSHKVRKLQKSALRECPTSYKGVYRHCMSYYFASKAAELANKIKGITYGGDGMKGYICFHQPSGRRVEVRADSSFAARNEGAALMKVKPLDVYAIVAEDENGEAVVHSPASLL